MGYRTSRDAWTKYHLITATEEKTFSTATNLSKQPRFTKNFYSSQPLSDNAAVMFVYDRKNSVIPYWHKYMEKWQNQDRLSESYMLRGAWDPDTNNQVDLQLLYAPHTSTYIRANTKNGEYTNEGGGFSANLQWENKNRLGRMMTNLVYKQNENTINNQKRDYFNWLKTPSIDWASSASTAQEGGFGRVETAQRSINLKQSFQFTPFSTYVVEHQWDTGYDAMLSEAMYRRKENTYSYTSPRRSSTIVCGGDKKPAAAHHYRHVA
ncbi:MULTISPECIES: hypothetical protein [Symbiopectobacterium]|uniref:hypothetical protein n=1 Tax=Symbiopectobacterium TaxID=801 RepID=UPI00207AC0C1|nr:MULTISPECIES: hypothetical protein [Symbiopectobacterium]